MNSIPHNPRDSAKSSQERGAAALEYAGRGYHVFPVHTMRDGRCSCASPSCSRAGKHPLTPNGLKDATADEETITAWWDRWPDANIAIATGPSGLVVLDFDAGKGGEESYQGLHGQHGAALGDTATVLTGGGGRHKFFRCPEGVTIRNSSGKLAPGSDVRAQGGYVVAPPSIHASGQRYEWVRELGSDPAPLPPALAQQLAEQAPKAALPTSAGGILILHGQRNDELTSLAGTMRRRGMGESSIRAALLAENASRCRPPLPEDEVCVIAHSVARYEPAPRDTGGEGSPADLEATAAEDAYVPVPGTAFFFNPERTALYRPRVAKGVRFFTETEPAIPFCPKVLEHIHVKGAEEGREIWYRIRVGSHEELIPYETMRRGTCWEHFPDAEGCEGPANAPVLANAVRTLAKPLPLIPGYMVAGWHETAPDMWRFVFPDGRTIPPLPDEGRVRLVDFPESLIERFECLPVVPAIAEQGAVSSALLFVESVEPEQKAALLALACGARTLIHCLLPAEFSCVVEGEAGSGKTSIASLACSLLAPFTRPFPPDPPDTSFGGTATSIEFALGRLQSMPALADDLALPPGATPAELRRAGEKLDTLVRAHANAAPIRPRMTRNLQERRSQRCETVVFLTVERLPDMLRSWYRRTFLIQVRLGQVDVDELACKSAQHLPAITALGHDIVQTIAQRLASEGLAAVQADLRECRAAYARQVRGALTEELGEEPPQIAQSLVVHGADVLLGAHLLGLPSGLGESLCELLIHPIARTLAAQIAVIEGTANDQALGPFGLLVQMLSEKIQGHIRINGDYWRLAALDSMGTDDTAPDVRTAAGAPVPAHVWGDFSFDPSPKPVTVGMVDGDAGAVYLTGPARQELLRMAAHMDGCQALTSERALYRAAAQEGWIRRTGTGKTTVRVVHRGARIRVLDLKLERLLEAMGNDPAPSPEKQSADGWEAF